MPATADTLGGIKVGSNLTITDDGTLSATGGGGTAVLEARIAALEQLLAGYSDTDLSVYSNGTSINKVVLAKDPQP